MIYVHRLYDYVRGRRIRRSAGRLFFGSMARSPVLVSSRVTAGADSVAVGSGGLCEMRKKGVPLESKPITNPLALW